MSAITAYASQFAHYVSRNFSAFLNSSVQYSKHVWNSHYVQKIAAFAEPHFIKAKEHCYDLTKFNYTPKNAAIGAGILTLFAFYAIGRADEAAKAKEAANSK